MKIADATPEELEELKNRYTNVSTIDISQPIGKVAEVHEVHLDDSTMKVFRDISDNHNRALMEVLNARTVKPSEPAKTTHAKPERKKFSVEFPCVTSYAIGFVTGGIFAAIVNVIVSIIT